MARQRPTRLVMGPCIVEIDRIVIKEVQYQLEVNWCRNEEIIVKGNFRWPMWAGRPRVGNGAMHMNRCRNKEIIVKGHFGWAWPMWAGCPRINRIVIREVQYQFEVNQCRNEEVIVKGNFGWAWPMWAGRLRVGNGAMHKVQYQFERGAPGLVMGPCIVEIDCIVIREVQYQFEDNRCRNEEILLAKTNQPTNQQTNQPTNRPTDRAKTVCPPLL
ncbi:hypothetical protein DPMN_014711 [Dreissena polymorpha]|uniref:Uncharacterized protein n=1 Tax=Dreissena polymorpha TaxID=45954 RepID=A0A9D4S3Q6_DREPO|nr:hypothetical protein DPMN_014711 [Dreissena polymorpha]